MDNWSVLTILLIFISGCFSDREQSYFEQQPSTKLSDSSFLNSPLQTGFVQFSPVKPSLMPIQVRRKKRTLPPSSSSSSSSASASGVAEDVCPSVSDWVAKTHAVDPYGNEVRIVQRISVNGTLVNQYFYETFCATDLVYEYDDFFGTSYQRVETPESTQCKGIDVQKWNSHCKENYIWTYGKVADASGQSGWSIIGIRGSCSCAIWPKVQPRSNSLPSLLSMSRAQKTSSSGPSSSSGRGRRLISDSRGSLIKSKIQSDPFF